jgi:hypothetical protein
MRQNIKNMFLLILFGILHHLVNVQASEYEVETAYIEPITRFANWSPGFE